MKKPRILAIDDEIKALDLLKLILENSGFEMLVTADGACGLNIAAREIPDLIILDIRMPGMDGWEVCRNLKLNSHTERIPVIFLSAYSSTHDQQRANSLGVNVYITKPVDPDYLVKQIFQLLTYTDY